MGAFLKAILAAAGIGWDGVKGAAGFVAKHWRGLLVLLLALLLWRFINLSADRGAALVSQAESFKAAQMKAQQDAQAAIAHQESTWRLRAQIEDTNHAKELADARAAADRYIADHRVRPQAAQGGSGTADASGTGDGAGIRQDVPATGVVVSEQDVHSCTEVTTYALRLRNWALGLNDPASEQ